MSLRRSPHRRAEPLGRAFVAGRTALLAGCALLLLSSCRDHSPLLSPGGQEVRSEHGPRTGQAKPRPEVSLFGGTSTAITTVDLAASGGPTAADLAQALVGAGVTVSNVTYTGAPRAAGSFSSTDAGIVGFDGGIILSSGDIFHVVGPNEIDFVSYAQESPYNAGDADLNSLTGRTTFDAAVLEFDFVPDADKVYFEYVFASDEYNEYVNSPFNDGFAFLVNGQNCAMVGQLPVSINTVNGGNPFGNNASNPDRFRNNDLSDGGGAIDTEMDGLTTVLVCEASVNPGVTNHIKLAIADASDQVYDSNVFIKAGSFSTTPPPTVNQPPTAALSATPNPAEVGASVSFDGSASTDPEGDPLTYSWIFGDPYVASPGDNTATGVTASHVYSRAGTYTAVLTVDDGQGNQDSAELTVRVNNVVEVTVTGSPGVAGITVTLTNAVTGQAFFALTNNQGKAKFVLDPDETGDFFASARRLSSQDIAQLEYWPPADNIALLPTGHQGQPAYTPVISNGTAGSHLLDPAGLCRAIENAFPQEDGSPRTQIALQFAQGATVQGTLVDANGEPFTLNANEQIFGATQLTPENAPCRLPDIYDPDNSIPPGLKASGQRFIGWGVQRLPANQQSTFSMPGASAGTHFFETPPMQTPDGETVKYVFTTTVTESEASSGATKEEVAGPTPVLASSFYGSDALGDNGAGPQDIAGAIVAGFKPGVGQQPSTTLAVTSGYQGNGHFTLEIWTGGDPGSTPGQPDITITGLCEAKRCKLQPSAPKPPASAVVSGVVVKQKGTFKGTLNWTVDLPSVAVGQDVWFRIGNSHRRPAYTDTAPDAGTFRVKRQGGGGNTFIVMSTS